MRSRTVLEEVTVAGLKLKKGDIVEIVMGRRTIVGEFQGFDRMLYAFYIREIDTNIDRVIPYKYIKMVSKQSNAETTQGEEQ